MFEQRINIDRMEQAVALFGSFDENIKLIENEYTVNVVGRGSEIKVSGEPENVAKAVRVIESLLTLINRGEVLSEQNIRYCIALVNEGTEEKIETLAGDCICVTSKGKPVKPKTLGQKKYCNAIKENTITIGVGPAGTGKTYLAVALAVTAFRAQQVNRIILTRPAVEQAECYGHGLDREVGYLTAHSMLHLLGYDHEQGGIDRVRMREKEEQVMTQLGLPASSSYVLDEDEE